MRISTLQLRLKRILGEYLRHQRLEERHYGTSHLVVGVHHLRTQGVNESVPMCLSALGGTEEDEVCEAE